MAYPFSALARRNLLNTMSTGQYDLLIIGGGVTGAGIALDASLRGMKVALVEMQDFAAGTSSRSTKLVHGGLRYLKQFQVSMVADMGKERAIVYENGPHVTTPEWMLLPLYKDGTFGKWSTSIGLRVYDFLADVKKSERRKMLSAEEILEKEPLLKKEGLIGGGYYVEYRTDDARLTIEVMKAAVANGTHAVNYARADGFLYEKQRVIGARVIDVLSKDTYEIRATKVVNAAGAWVDEVRQKDHTRNHKQLRLTKGVHIVIDQSAFPLRQAVYFDTPDGRMVFAIPREGKTYVGTTDTFYNEDPASPKMLNQDRAYLLHAIAYMFPDVNIQEKHIESSWAGVRPLIYEEGKNPSEISRKDEIWEEKSGLITIAGGKLTGYRKMAESVVDLIAKHLFQENKERFKECQTKTSPISGGDLGGAEALGLFIAKKEVEAIHYGFTKEEGRYLAQLYGANVDQLFRYRKQYEEIGERSIPGILYAKLMYAMEQEMAVKPVDFFIRRTGALFFHIDWVSTWKDTVTAFMAEKMGWTKEETAAYKEELEKELQDAVVPVIRP